MINNGINFALRKLKSLALHIKINLSIKDYSTIQGWLTPLEAYYLYYYAKKLPKTAVVVEIGSWKGKSTYCLAKGLKNGKVFAIDPFEVNGEEDSLVAYSKAKGSEPLFIQFMKNLKRLNVYDKIVPLKGYSRDFVNKFNSIDLLFIDGNHSIPECLFDYQNYANKISTNGFLLIHDYVPNRKKLGPTSVIENHILPSNLFKEVGIYNSLWIGRKK